MRFFHNKDFLLTFSHCTNFATILYARGLRLVSKWREWSALQLSSAGILDFRGTLLISTFSYVLLENEEKYLHLSLLRSLMIASWVWNLASLFLGVKKTRTCCYKKNYVWWPDRIWTTERIVFLLRSAFHLRDDMW